MDATVSFFPSMNIKQEIESSTNPSDEGTSSTNGSNQAPDSVENKVSLLIICVYICVCMFI